MFFATFGVNSPYSGYIQIIIARDIQAAENLMHLNYGNKFMNVYNKSEAVDLIKRFDYKTLHNVLKGEEDEIKRSI